MISKIQQLQEELVEVKKTKNILEKKLNQK